MHPVDLGARARRSRPRRVPRTLGAIAAAMMAWSAIAAPPLQGQEGQVQEPENLAAYATFADAMPIQLYFDHQTRQIPLGPAIAHAQSEVTLPSAASAISWLVDAGIANGLHGTTTGAKVPTEASAKQPGGEDEEEFRVAGGPIGDPDFIVVSAGRAYSVATHSNNPRAYGTAHLGNLLVLPAAGSPPDPPGTYDPDGTFPGAEPGETDPAPRGQMGILSIGSIASTSESVREGSKVRSIAVAELQDINIGNRTSDNRCTNCIRIDKIRAETFTEAAGTPGSSRASFRVILGRACRRSFDAETGKEIDRCLPLDPHDPQGTDGLQSVQEFERVNDFFEKPVWSQITNGDVNYLVGIRIHAGTEHRDDSRSGRTSDPPEDPHRNYAYPASPKKDRDKGEVARAVAEGLDVEIYTITLTQVYDDANARIMSSPAGDLIRAIDEDDRSPGLQISGPGPLANVTGQQTIPTDTIRSVRRLHMAFGVARSSAVARSMAAFDTGGGGSAGPPGAPGAFGPPAPPAPGAPGGGTTVPPGSTVGLTGPFDLKIDWSSFAVRPWPPYDMAKAIFIGGMIAALWWLGKRRLALRR